MDNPWNFFKSIYVISLKDQEEKREHMKKTLERFDGLKYTFFDAVNGKKNHYLRRSLIDRKIVSEKAGASLTDGQLGCLASHRAIWEKEMLAVDSKEPFWVLIMEDDVLFYPDFSNKLMKEYIDNIPENAIFIKFAFLARDSFFKKYKQQNKYWINFEFEASFSTICYAVHSDLLQFLIKHTFTAAVDTLAIPNSYGANNPELLLGIETNEEFRLYRNPCFDYLELFHGIASVKEDESQTAPKISHM